MSKLLSVIRGALVDRSSLGGLTGTAYISVTTKSYLHIGSGKELIALDPEIVDVVLRSKSLAEVVRYLRTLRGASVGSKCFEFVRYGGKLCIPGSSIKGLIRSRLELLAKPINNSIESCFRVPSPPITTKPPKGVHGWRHVRIWWDAPAQDRRPTCNPLQEGYIELCVVCNIFGAPGVASRVFFSNACCTSDVKTVKKVLDYGECLELVPPNTVFKGSFSFRGLRLEELGLILIGAGAREDGGFNEVLMGKSKYRLRRLGGKSIELGRVLFSINAFRFRKYLELPKELNNIISKCRYEDSVIICEGDIARELISHLVKLAKSKYRSFKEATQFSEVVRKDEVSKEG